MSTLTIIIITIAEFILIPIPREFENELLVSKIRQLHEEIQEYVEEYGTEDFEEKIKKRLLSE